MPAPDARLPTDLATDRLIQLYVDAEIRLRLLIQQAVLSGSLGQAGYRQAQQAQALAIIARLREEAGPLAAETMEGVYSASALAVDAVMTNTAGAFGGVHEDSVRILTNALTGTLEDACQTVGRQAQDVFQTSALRILAESQVTGETTRESARRLVATLVDDGIEAFVDKAGRSWKLASYAKMVARTSLREAVTVASVNRIQENGGDLVTVSDHDTDTEVCQAYEGETFSLSGSTPGYEVLDDFPPFHPNCQHVLTPAEATLDAYEAALDSG